MLEFGFLDTPASPILPGVWNAHHSCTMGVLENIYEGLTMC